MSSIGSDTIRVLVIDDEPDLSHGISRIIRGFHVDVPDVGLHSQFEVVSSASAEEGLECIKSQQPDILLLDHKLPGMSGMDLLMQLGKSNQRDFLVVMVTAYANLETAVKATKLGAYDFLAKPFTPEELRYVLKKSVTHLALKRKARMAEDERRKVRFEFLSVLAHELKAPLNAVEGYLDILKERLCGEELQMVNRSLARTDGMRKLIFDLLDLTRIESGLKKRDLSKMDLTEVVANAVDAVWHDADTRGIKVIFDAGRAVPFTADRNEFEIIANNLLSNAVKYNRDRGTVDVTLERRGSELVFEVSDTGIGLTQEEASKLFQEFMRIKNEQTSRIMGSGIGLSTVRKLARLYGGDATVRSEPGKGSTFTVVLKEPDSSTQPNP